jgi:hypothetical protein
MATTTHDLAVTKKLISLQTQQTQTAPSGFVAPNTPPNYSEMIAQWNMFAYNKKDQ